MLPWFRKRQAPPADVHLHGEVMKLQSEVRALQTDMAALHGQVVKWMKREAGGTRSAAATAASLPPVSPAVQRILERRAARGLPVNGGE